MATKAMAAARKTDRWAGRAKLENALPSAASRRWTRPRAGRGQAVEHRLETPESLPDGPETMPDGKASEHPPELPSRGSGLESKGQHADGEAGHCQGAQGLVVDSVQASPTALHNHSPTSGHKGRAGGMQRVSATPTPTTSANGRRA